MKTFEQYICEIGDSRNPFKYKLTIKPKKIAHWSDEEGVYVQRGVAKFKTDQKLNYIQHMMISPEPRVKGYVYECSVDFAATNKIMGQDHASFDVVDAGLAHAFRVMATVVAATKEFVQKVWKKEGIKATEIAFDSDSSGKQGDSPHPRKQEQRNKLYIAFIKKEISGAKVDFHPMGEIRVEIPDRFYK